MDFEITYIISGWGLKNGYVVFGFKERVVIMSDTKLTVDTIAELQSENERLKRLSKDWLEEKKTLNDKLSKIASILKRPVGFSEEEKAYNYMMQVIDIREVIEQE